VCVFPNTVILVALRVTHEVWGQHALPGGSRRFGGVSARLGVLHGAAPLPADGPPTISERSIRSAGWPTGPLIPIAALTRASSPGPELQTLFLVLLTCSIICISAHAFRSIFCCPVRGSGLRPQRTPLSSVHEAPQAAPTHALYQESGGPSVT